MKAVSFYRKDTGLFNGTHLIASDAKVVALNTPAGHIAIDGHHDHLSQKVDLATGHIVDYRPPRPSPDDEWNMETKRWEPSAAAVAQASKRAAAGARIEQMHIASVRALREHALGIGDAAVRLKAIDDEIALLRPIAAGETGGEK